jgi:hypothetical protein
LQFFGVFGITHENIIVRDCYFYATRFTTSCTFSPYRTGIVRASHILSSNRELGPRRPDIGEVFISPGSLSPCALSGHIIDLGLWRSGVYTQYPATTPRLRPSMSVGGYPGSAYPCMYKIYGGRRRRPCCLRVRKAAAGVPSVFGTGVKSLSTSGANRNFARHAGLDQLGS